MNLQELRAKRAEHVAAVTAIFDKLTADNGRQEFTPEEQASVDQLEAEIAATDKKIAFESAKERAGQRAADLTQSAGRVSAPGMEVAQPIPLTESTALAVQAWFRAHSSREWDMTDRHREACQAVGLNPHCKELILTLPSGSARSDMQRAYREAPRGEGFSRAMAMFHNIRADGPLSTHTYSEGGAIMPPDTMIGRLETNMLHYDSMRQVATILRNSTRGKIILPTVDDTMNMGRRIGESQPVVPLNPVFAGVTLDLYKYTSDEILVPFELLDGAPFDLPAILGDLLGERIGRKTQIDFTRGLGGSEPRGIVTAATTVAAASATDLSWADVVSLVGSVDPAYRDDGAFMMHDAIRAHIMNLKDGIGRPLWADSPNSTEPALLMGRRWYTNQAMDSTISAGKKTILYGQLRKYYVREHNTIRIYRLTERHRENDQDAFFAFLECDGNLLAVPGGTAPVKVLLH